MTLYVSKVRINQGERDKAEEYHARKKLEAQEKIDEADANTWWVKNNEKFVKMDVKNCHEYFKQTFIYQEVRPAVRKMLFERLCQWKGPPPPPPKQPSPPPRPQPCHEHCHKDTKGRTLKHSTLCKKWKEQECSGGCTKTVCVTYCPRYLHNGHWTEMKYE